MAMKVNRSVMSALLGVALLAMPITASAHEDWRNRRPAPAYNSYRHEAARANFETRWAPRAAANNVRWRDARDAEGWRDSYYRHHEVPAMAANCPIAPSYNTYANPYRQQGYYPQAYNPAPSYQGYQGYNEAPLPLQYGQYGAPMNGQVANLIRQRDNAQVLYRQAVANGNRDRAKHLLNDMIGLNKRIASARAHGGNGSAFANLNAPYASNYGAGNYGNGYGYGGPNALSSMMPLLGNYIH
jgi:hypothetical protein